MSLHRRTQCVEVASVGAMDGEPLVARVMLQVPLTSRGEVVVYRDRPGLQVREQAIDEVTPDESSSADEEETPPLDGGHPRASQVGALT